MLAVAVQSTVLLNSINEISPRTFKLKVINSYQRVSLYFSTHKHLIKIKQKQKSGLRLYKKTGIRVFILSNG